MLGKALCLSAGLFLSGFSAAQEKAPGTLEEMKAIKDTEEQNNASRTAPLPQPPAASQPVARCARGVYSFDCSASKAVMHADLALIEREKPVCNPQNFLYPGWRCD